MANNPYDPPRAPVSDSPRRGEPPKQVIWSVWLMRLSLVIGYSSLFLVPDMTAQMGAVPAETRSASIGFFFIALALTALVYLWLIQNVKTGRNWARVIMLLLTGLGVFSLLIGAEAPPLVRTISVVDTIIDITAMVLIFRAPGSAWFAPLAPQGRR